MFAHAVMLYVSSVAVNVLGKGYNTRNASEIINIDPNDPRKKDFQKIWNTSAIIFIFFGVYQSPTGLIIKYKLGKL